MVVVFRCSPLESFDKGFYDLLIFSCLFFALKQVFIKREKPVTLRIYYCIVGLRKRVLVPGFLNSLFRRFK